MISRTTHLTAPAWRNLIQACLEAGDIEAIMESLIQAAKGGNQGAAELIIRYTAGLPYKCPPPTEAWDCPELTDMDACAQALSDLLSAEAAGRVSGEAARSYRETIVAASRVFAAQKAEAAFETLTEQGSIPLVLEAGVDPLDAFKRALNVQEK